MISFQPLLEQPVYSVLTSLCSVCLSACWRMPLPYATQYVYPLAVAFSAVPSTGGISEDILVPPWDVNNLSFLVYLGGLELLSCEGHIADQCVTDGV